MLTLPDTVSLQALAGEVGMSSELDEVARALFNGQIPNIWRKLAPATLKSLGNWMEHFLKRLNQYNNWVSATELIMLICICGLIVVFVGVEYTEHFKYEIKQRVSKTRSRTAQSMKNNVSVLSCFVVLSLRV